MRLICPNCDAQYEVPDGVVPFEGRDVQCSDCGQTWFQHHPENIPVEEEEVPFEDPLPEPPAPPEAPVAQPKPREMESGIKDILREEAEFETASRARERESLESQPELGLNESNARSRNEESKARLAKIRGDQQSAAEAAAMAAATGSRRDLFPDIDEINSTLRSSNDRTFARTISIFSDENEARGRRGGFWGGFFMVMALVAVLFAIYVLAPDIARAVPALDPMLNAFVTAVDNGRVWLNGRMLGVINWLEQTAASQG